MKILLVTPLYPPDIADPAPYVKELASRLGRSHTVTVLAYNHLPERVPGVTIHTIEKSSPLPVRLFKMFVAIFRLGRSCDMIYVQNGPSTELPAAFATLLIRRPYILRLGDEAALSYATDHFLYRVVQRIAILRARRNVVHTPAMQEKVTTMFGSAAPTLLNRPLTRPEILPFSNRPNAAIGDYERAWKVHTSDLNKIFEACKK